jgi:hypothetical protein
MPGGLAAAQRDYDNLSAGSTVVPFDDGSMVRLPGEAGTVTLRPVIRFPVDQLCFMVLGHQWNDVRDLMVSRCWAR